MISIVVAATITRGRGPTARNVPPPGIVTVVPVSTQVSTVPIVMMCVQFDAVFVSKLFVFDSCRGCIGAVGKQVMPKPAPKHTRASGGTISPPGIDESFIGDASLPGSVLLTLVEKLQPATNAIKYDDRTCPYYPDGNGLA